ncbi:LysR substrate-binding domain-containing protein [Pelagibius sp. Alg239-R121]|uniref:LysR family transcriptional regulator n=1 Tax=Pelagibius sp. Alg239-R121 TaxID=2993448 RepID=UPI0024A67A6B|nr:LysR substrate-binding domain-containing protein [Pelagibius sp. Alg239-R121]
MDLKQLKTFIRVSDAGSLSSAADRLRIAQSALSRQIKLLETEVGAPLFDRHARGMSLTFHGQELYKRISPLIRQFEQSIDDVRSLGETITGHVSFGLMPTTSAKLADRLVSRVAQEQPGIFLRLVEGYAGHLVEWLQRDEIDGTLLYGPADSLHLRATPLFTEDLALISPAIWPEQVGVPVKFESAAALPLALPSQSHGLRSVVEVAARKADCHLNVCAEGDSFRVLKSLVLRGLYHTILPFSAVQEEAEAGLVKTNPLTRPNVTRQIVLARPSHRADTIATQAVVNILLDEIAAMIRTRDWVALPEEYLLQRNL